LARTWDDSLDGTLTGKCAVGRKAPQQHALLANSRRVRDFCCRGYRALGRCATVVASRTDERRRDSARTGKAQRAWPRALHRGASRRRKHESDGVLGERFALRRRLSFGYARRRRSKHTGTRTRRAARRYSNRGIAGCPTHRPCATVLHTSERLRVLEDG